MSFDACKDFLLASFPEVTAEQLGRFARLESFRLKLRSHAAIEER